MSAPGIDNLLAGKDKPSETVGGSLITWQGNNANRYSVLFLPTKRGGSCTASR